MYHPLNISTLNLLTEPLELSGGGVAQLFGTPAANQRYCTQILERGVVPEKPSTNPNAFQLVLAAPEEFDPKTLKLARNVGVLCVSPDRSYSEEVTAAVEASDPSPGSKARQETALSVARLASEAIFIEATRPRKLVDRVWAIGRVTTGGLGGAICSYVFSGTSPETIELLAGISAGMLAAVTAHALITTPFRGTINELERLHREEANEHKLNNIQIISGALLAQEEQPATE